MASFARRAMSLAQIPSARISSGAASIGQRRCLAGAAGKFSLPLPSLFDIYDFFRYQFWWRIAYFAHFMSNLCFHEF